MRTSIHVKKLFPFLKHENQGWERTFSYKHKVSQKKKPMKVLLELAWRGVWHVCEGCARLGARGSEGSTRAPTQEGLIKLVCLMTKGY